MISTTFIWHDCFVIDTENATVVFDYWKDPLMSEDSTAPAFITRRNRKKPLYIIVSHFHKDHYNKEIFGWCRHADNVHYIISKDTYRHARHILNPDSTYRGPKPKPSEATVLTPGDIFSDPIIKVEAFGSTDIGNSYSVELDGYKIFHAGDLNAWIWKDESTEKEVEEALRKYIGIIKKIKAYHKGFDIVMFPVDSRIGSEYFTGAKYFLEEIDVKRFFPMHFGLGEKSDQEKYAFDAMKFEEYCSSRCLEYVGLIAPYSRWFLNDAHE